jgi:hypothetical protein
VWNGVLGTDKRLKRIKEVVFKTMCSFEVAFTVLFVKSFADYLLFKIKTNDKSNVSYNLFLWAKV